MTNTYIIFSIIAGITLIAIGLILEFFYAIKKLSLKAPTEKGSTLPKFFPDFFFKGGNYFSGYFLILGIVSLELPIIKVIADINNNIALVFGVLILFFIGQLINKFSRYLIYYWVFLKNKKQNIS